VCPEAAALRGAKAEPALDSYKESPLQFLRHPPVWRGCGLGRRAACVSDMCSSGKRLTRPLQLPFPKALTSRLETDAGNVGENIYPIFAHFYGRQKNTVRTGTKTDET
jgi:hypothetical protein